MSNHIIIVGAAKSGTSTLMEHLDEHDRVNTSAGKEPRYFCDGYYEEYLERGVEYEDLWDDGKGDIYLEASTGYTKYPAVTGPVENMSDYGIDPKIIYIVREPVERMISHAKYMMWRKRNVNIEYLREACVSASKYYTQSTRYLNQFDRKRIKTITLKELSEDAEKVVEGLFRFIGVEEVPKVRDVKENETRTVTNFELLVRKSSLWRMKSYVPNVVKSQIRSLWSVFSEGPEREVVSGIEEERIRDMCQDALRLEDVFNIDISHWRESIDHSYIHH